MIKKSILLLFFTSLFDNLYCQQLNYWSNLHAKTILFKDTFVLDELPILPNSIKILSKGKPVDISLFGIDYVRSKLSSDKMFKDSLLIIYRTIPLKKSSFISTKSKTNLFQNTISPVLNYNYDIENTQSNELSYSGSFVRGITMGNRQSAAINSGFNLNLIGKLANGLEINASMTDANIPIQPDGNSASIQEFDKIYIQLKKDSHHITLGDFDLQNLSNNYFLKFDRKLQGIKYQTSFALPKNNKLSIGSSVAVTRGTFARNIFQAQENNQGPYKLVGNNGEAFIIIIAGTERVFINGQLLKRGEDNDYIINYNVGEVVFTPNRLITQDLRIVIEFQYSDKNYFRYSLEGNANLITKKSNFYSQIYLENDNRNQPINAELTKPQIIRLSEIGNQLDSALIVSASEVKWDATRITYVLKDTIVNSQSYSIYQWAQSSSSPVFQVLYTQVGFQNGHYRLKSTAANGTVYEWIAPINGVLQGNYEPIRRITTPKTQLQLISGTVHQWNENNKSNLEVSYTDHDLNTFSDIQQNENKGIALNFNHNFIKKIRDNKSVQIELGQEYTSQFFSPLTRYRSNEFQRDWSLNLPIKNSQEQSITKFNSQLNFDKLQSKFGLNYFLIPNYFNGIESKFDLLWSWKTLSFKTNHSIVKGNLNDSTTLFYRPNFMMSNYFFHQKYKLELGFNHELNRKQTKLIAFLPNSFFWQNYFLNFEAKFKNQNSFNFQYIYRTEQQSDSFEFIEAHTTSHTFSIFGINDFSSSQILKYTLKYRNFSSILNQEIQHNYLGKLDYSGHYFGGAIRWNSGYEIKAGREQKMQMTYIRAPNGYGNYAWQDLNNNGVFELNEAYISPILTENNYTKYFVVLPEFIPANEVNFSQLISIQPRAIWFDKLDFRNFISKFSYQMRLDLNKKGRIFKGIELTDYANPFNTSNDSLLVFSRNNVFQQLSFQKNENKIGFDLEWIYSNANNLLSNGVEGFSNNSYALKTRIELVYFLTYFNKISNGFKKNTSEYFIERNFSMVENIIENSLSFLVNKNIKINLNANYGFRSTGIQYSVSHQGDLELKIARKNDGIIESKFTLMNLNYQANSSNPQVELSMLNGIPKGLNYIWNLTLGQKLTQYLQINIIYNGRKNENSDIIIHSGNVEARAIF